MANWIDELCEEILRDGRHKSVAEELRLHRAGVLEQEGRFFFEELRREVKDGLPTIGTRLGLSPADLRFEGKDDFFQITNHSHYPVVTVKAEYMLKRVLLNIKRKQADVRTPAEETRDSIDFCVKADDELYFCHKGTTLPGIDEAVKLVFRPLFST